MQIAEKWELDNKGMSEREQLVMPVTILADDGAKYTMYGPRAMRLTTLWNLFRGIPLSAIERLTPEDIEDVLTKRQAEENAKRSFLNRPGTRKKGTKK